MNAATEGIADILRAKDWNFEMDDDTQMVYTGFNGKNGQWRIVTGGLNDFTVLILSQFPIDCPEPQRQVSAELLTRINFGLFAGTFELDYDTGRIRFKSTQAFDKELPTPEEFWLLFMPHLLAMDRFLPTIMQVIYSNTSPTKALAELEKSLAREQKAENPRGNLKQSGLNGPSRFQMN
jgi:hypothetical protein